MAQLAQPTGTIGGISGKILKILTDEVGGLSASHLAIRLGLSKRTVYNHLMSLKKQHKVLNMRPLWLTGINLRESQNVPVPCASGNIEIHNLVFNLKLIQKPFWWNTRHTKLLKLKEYQMRPLNFGHNPYIQLMDDICFVNMYKNSIMFIMRKTYRDIDAYACLSQGIEDFMLIYKKIEQLCGFQFFKDGVPQASIVKCHSVKLYDAIAKKLTKDGKHFQVFHDGKLRLLIDMSHPKGIEAIHPEYSVDDVDTIQRNYEDIIANHPPLPSEVYSQVVAQAKTAELIIQSQATLVNQMGEFMQIQDAYAQNIKSHISAIQTLGSKVGELVTQIDKLNEVYMKLGGAKDVKDKEKQA